MTTPQVFRDVAIYEEELVLPKVDNPEVRAKIERAVLEHMQRILILLHPLMAPAKYANPEDLTAAERVARATYSAVHNAEKHWLRELGRPGT